jgi:hypothetical protein
MKNQLLHEGLAPYLARVLGLTIDDQVTNGSEVEIKLHSIQSIEALSFAVKGALYTYYGDSKPLQVAPFDELSTRSYLNDGANNVCIIEFVITARTITLTIEEIESE